MKTSIKRMRQFAAAVNFIRENYKEAEKVNEAISRITPSINENFPKHDKLAKNLKLKHANTDSNGSLLYLPDKSDFTYTKQSLPVLEEELDSLLDEEIFEYEPVFISELPDNFSKELIPFLEGFIIKKDQ